MPLTHAPDRVSIIGSILHYIRNHQFVSGGSTTTIADKYPNISFGLGFPDLTKLDPPHIAVALKESRPRTTVTWERSEKPYTAYVYGFVGRLSGGEANALQLDQLLADVENIFDEQRGGQNVIDLLDFSTGSGPRTVLDSLRISDVDGRPIEAGQDDTLDVSKYRFTVTMTVGLWKSQ